MSPKTLKIIAVGLVIVALALGFTGWQLTQQAVTPPVTASAVESATELPLRRHPVVVATRHLAAGTRLGSDAVTQAATQAPRLAVVDFPTAVPGTFAAREALEGRVLTRPVDAGEAIREDDFALGSVLASQIPAGYRALAIGVDEVVGGGGFIAPGDRVDVLFQAQAAASGERRQPLARRLLEDVLVLGYGDDLRGRAEDADNAGRRGARTAVVAVTDAQAPKLLLADSTGRLRLAVVGSRERVDRLLANVVTAPDGGGMVVGLSRSAGDTARGASRNEPDTQGDTLAPAVTYAEIAAIDKEAASSRSSRAPAGHRVVQYVGGERRIIETSN